MCLNWVWVNTYRYSLLGDEHPFATYFDVHQGYKVLTHIQLFLWGAMYFSEEIQGQLGSLEASCNS